jgi:hypothetical protein
MTRAFDRALLQASLLARLADANLCINGFMEWSQENGSTAVGNGKYPVDQFYFVVSATGMTAQQVSSPFPTAPDIYFGTKLLAPNAYTLGAGESISFQQSIEGTFLRKLRYAAVNARPLTIAFLLRPSYTGVAGLSLVNLANASGPYRSIVHRLALVANQDNFFCFTLSGDQAAALLGSTAPALAIRWCFGGGATYQTATLDAWQAGNFLASPDITNMAAVAGQSVVIGGCVALIGSVAITQDQLPLLARRLDEEERLCKRYYETGTVDVLVGYSNSQNAATGTMQPIVKKRVPPSYSWNITYQSNLYTFSIRAMGDHAQAYVSPNTVGGVEVVASFTANSRM